jgi:hypothetical protein
MRLVTFNLFVVSNATGNVQLLCVAGIAAANCSHVKQFPDRPAYDDYYDIVVDTGEIGVEQFAVRVQSLLVQYLRARYGDDTANWCERFWTGDRGRYCLVHSRYAGCNNNMGAEVTWRDIKKSCDSLGTLGAFIGTLCRWIATAMGEENMKRLRGDSGVPTAFIRAPRPIKEMWDQLQGVHRLTLSCCIIIESPRQHAQHAYIDLMADVMECSTLRLRYITTSAWRLEMRCRSNYLI